MAAQRKKVGRPKAKAPWSTTMGFRPYLLVDFRTNPAVHCLLYDNPVGLPALVIRGLELAMQEKGLEYLDPAFQQVFVGKPQGQDHSFPPRGMSPRVEPVQPVPIEYIEPVASSFSPATAPSTPPVSQDRPTVVPQPPPVMPQPLSERPKPAGGMTSFLAKAIRDAQ